MGTTLVNTSGSGEEGLYVFSRNGENLTEVLSKDEAQEFLKDVFAKTKGKGDDVVSKYLDELKVRVGKIRKFNFKTNPLNKKYVGENSESLKGMGNFPDSPPNSRWCWPYSVKYLDDIERLKYKVTIKNKKIYNNKGKLIDTESAGVGSGCSKNAIFVMDRDGTIYLSNFYSPRYFHHSSFFTGERVAAAGEIKVVKGVIKEIDLSSGHYEPTLELNKQIIEMLEDVFEITNIKLKNSYY